MSPVVDLPPPPSEVALHANAFARARAPHGWTAHVVRPGETIFGLALRYHTTVQALVERNNLRGGGTIIQSGSRLHVPRTGAAPHRSTRAHTHTAAQRRAHKRTVRHTRVVIVAPGETVSGIALRLHASWSAILKANGLTDARLLQVGQRLRVPVSGSGRAAPVRRAATRPARRMRTVIVQPGETVSGIALRLHTSWSAILAANGLRDARALQAGQRLRVPVTGSPARRRAAPARSGGNTFAGRTYADAIVSSADANRRWLATHPAPSRSQTRDLIVATARRNGVDPRLALAIAWQESGWNQRVVSVANAIGTMQVIPSTGQWASQMAGRRLNLLRAEDNVTAGVVLLRALTRGAANEAQAIAGYYQGLAGVQQNGMYADTRQYVRNVLYAKSRM